MENCLTALKPVLDIKNRILFEDDYILLVDKPAGLMVEPDRNNYPNLQQSVKEYLKKKDSLKDVYAQHLHRLDRPVSGVILFAKKKEVLRNLSEQFAERKVQKTYHALTVQAPQSTEGRLEHWHRKEKKKAVLSMEPLPFSEKAILSYSLEGKMKEDFLWKIDLHTGKFHQIRAQLSYIGCPIKGDVLYGSEAEYYPDAIALHASFLKFMHPVSEDSMNISSPIPF